MDNRADLTAAKAQSAGAISDMPADQRAAPPTNDNGEPQIEIVRALYRYENPKPGEVRWIEVRELNDEAWNSVLTAHRDVYTLTRGLDAFPSIAWGDLRNARDELLRQLRDQTRPSEWMGPLLEYRILSYSTALKLYHENVAAKAHRLGGTELEEQVATAFSELYDRSFAYRLLYSMRNAFQHGARGLVSLNMVARFAKGSNSERESEAHANLEKEVFAAGRSNAVVRRQVREMHGDIDLFKLGEEAFTEVEMIHSQLVPLLHPGAPAAARLIMDYMAEIGGERAHFHEYVRGLPTKGILGTTTLDRIGFDYVVRQAGGRAVYETGLPPDVMAVLPTYPSAS